MSRQPARPHRSQWIFLFLFTGCVHPVGTRPSDDPSDFSLVPAPSSAPAPLGDEPLDRNALVRAVLARNPSVDAARESLRAANAAPAQAAAWDDPTFEYRFAPLSITSDVVRYGQVLTLAQRIPWPGKRTLAEDVARAEADASKDELRRVQLELAVAAATLYDRHYAIARALELNVEHERLVEEITVSARNQYEAGRAPQQDVLQADVEIAHVLHQRLVLRSRRAVILAQINGLLHREPHRPLILAVEAPATIDLAEGAEALQEQALRSRPELSGLRAQIEGSAAAVTLAQRGYLPDFGAMVSYNSMWAQLDHRWMVGITLSLPFVQLGARDASVTEAEARRAEKEAQLVRMQDDVRVQVETARQQLLEAQHVVHLFRERLLVSARAQIAAARVGYETGQNGFQALVAAERSLRDLELQFEEALAMVGQRRAELDFAMGRMPALETGADQAPTSDDGGATGGRS